MKEDMKGQLIKDIVIAVVAWVLATVLLVSIQGGGMVLFDIFAGFVCAGIPFGWKWASKLFVAISLHTFIFKVILSILLGWIALPVAIITDVIELIRAD